MHQTRTQQNTRGKDIISYPTLRDCDTFVPSAAPSPILTLDHHLHKILKARKSDPIGYQSTTHTSKLPVPGNLGGVRVEQVSVKGAWADYSQRKNRTAPSGRLGTSR
jgi:hypothetical protein